MKRRHLSQYNEPALWPNTRTDGEAYAETALSDLLAALGTMSEREQGYIRDALAEAFRDGEHQGECRGVRILAIARANADSPAAVRAIGAALQVLAGED